MQMKLTEWEGSSGKFYCACVDDLGRNSGAWWVPARGLDLPLPQYLKMLYEDYDASIESTKSGTYIIYWTDQARMRKFKNWANKYYRDHKVTI